MLKHFIMHVWVSRNGIWVNMSTCFQELIVFISLLIPQKRYIYIYIIKIIIIIIIILNISIIIIIIIISLQWKVKKFLVGRQFFVIFVVFLIAQLTSFPGIIIIIIIITIIITIIIIIIIKVSHLISSVCLISWLSY